MDTELDRDEDAPIPLTYPLGDWMLVVVGDLVAYWVGPDQRPVRVPIGEA